MHIALTSMNEIMFKGKAIATVLHINEFFCALTNHLFYMRFFSITDEFFSAIHRMHFDSSKDLLANLWGICIKCRCCHSAQHSFLGSECSFCDIEFWFCRVNLFVTIFSKSDFIVINFLAQEINFWLESKSIDYESGEWMKLTMIFFGLNYIFLCTYYQTIIEQ